MSSIKDRQHHQQFRLEEEGAEELTIDIASETAAAAAAAAETQQYDETSTTRSLSPTAANQDGEQQQHSNHSASNNKKAQVVKKEDANSKPKETPLPYKRLIVACLYIFCEGFTGNQIFPYLGFMIVAFGLAESRDQAGYYSGYIASAYFLAQFLSVFTWGRLSDKFGRRPILIFGAIGSFFCALLFGFSKWYAWAIAARFLTGLLNGNISVVRSYVGEITDTSNAAKAFSYVGLMFGLSNMVAPMVGGFLSQPAEKYPTLFPKGGFLDKFPFILPNVVSALVNLVGIITGILFLTESNPNAISPLDAAKSTLESLKQHWRYKRYTWRFRTWRLIRQRKQHNEHEHEHEHDDGDNEQTTGADNYNDNDDEIELVSVMEKKNNKSINNNNNNNKKKKEDEAVASIFHGGSDDDDDIIVFVREEEEEEEEEDPALLKKKAALLKANQQEPVNKKVAGKKFSVFRALMQRETILACVCFSSTQIANQVYNVIFPLLAILPVEEGGMGFSSDRIGVISFISGAFAVVFQLFINAPVANRLGVLNTFRCGLLFSVPTIFALPFTNYILTVGASTATSVLEDGTTAVITSPSTFRQVIFWIVLIVTLLLRTSGLFLTSTSGQRLVNHSVERAYAGSANGLSQTFMSGANIFFPTLVGIAFAWSVTAPHSTPAIVLWFRNHHLMFVLLSAWLCIVLFISLLLPKSINKPKANPQPTTQQQELQKVTGDDDADAKKQAQRQQQ